MKILNHFAINLFIFKILNNRAIKIKKRADGQRYNMNETMSEAMY